MNIASMITSLGSVNCGMSLSRGKCHRTAGPHPSLTPPLCIINMRKMHTSFDEMPFLSFIVIVNFFLVISLFALMLHSVSYYFMWLARGIFCMTVLRRDGEVLW